MSQLPNALRAALAPFSPQASSVQFSEAELIAADMQNERYKDGYNERNQAKALALQIKANPEQWI